MGILEVREMYKDFRGLEVLMGINLSVEEGERHSVIGPNGAGKSTLFNLITGMYKPTKGHIYFRGEDITGKPPYKITRMGLARSFQIINLFPNMTVFENIRNAIISKEDKRFHFMTSLSKMQQINEKASELIHIIGLADQSDTPAGELSYGQQRALEIGVTLATDPQLILLDEPTAGMSTEETREAVKLIERITEGRTLVIVEHDMEVVFSISDRITVLHYGNILATGTPDEIRENEEVKKAYLGSKR